MLKNTQTNEGVFFDTVLESSVLFAVRVRYVRDKYLFVPLYLRCRPRRVKLFCFRYFKLFLLGIWVNMVLRINKTFLCLDANLVTFYISNNLKNLEITRVSLYGRTRVKKFSFFSILLSCIFWGDNSERTTFSIVRQMNWW